MLQSAACTKAASERAWLLDHPIRLLWRFWFGRQKPILFGLRQFSKLFQKLSELNPPFNQILEQPKPVRGFVHHVRWHPIGA
jgi:hypothetical protein